MTVKIDASVLGIRRPVQVKETTRNLKATLKLQIALNKDVDVSGDAGWEEYLEESLKSQESLIDYVVNTLKLTDAQAEKLEDLEGVELGELVGQITAAILHFDLTPEEGEEVENNTPGKE